MISDLNLKIEPHLMSQIQNGVHPVDYLNEGLWIMKDFTAFLQQIKSGSPAGSTGKKRGLVLQLDSDRDSGSASNRGAHEQNSNLRRNRDAGSLHSLSGIKNLKRRKKIQNVINSVHGTKLPSLTGKSPQSQFPDRISRKEGQEERDDVSVSNTRAKQVQRLENEFMKLEKRFAEITNPEYISGIQSKLLVAEQDRKDKLESIKKLEISQKLLDRQIDKLDKQKERMIGRLHAGKVVDAVKLKAKNTIADIEVCSLKLEVQDQDLKKLNADNGDLRSIYLDWRNNHEQLVAVAQERYDIDTDQLDEYLPPTEKKNLERFVRNQERERQLLRKAAKDKVRLQNDLRDKRNETKAKSELKSDRDLRLLVLKRKLEERAKRAQEVIDEARAAGTDSEQLQMLLQLNERIRELGARSGQQGERTEKSAKILLNQPSGPSQKEHQSKPTENKKPKVSSSVTQLKGIGMLTSGHSPARRYPSFKPLPLGDRGYSPKGAPAPQKKLKSRIGGGLYNAYSPPIKTDKFNIKLQMKGAKMSGREDSPDKAASGESSAAKSALQQLDNDQIKQRWAELNVSPNLQVINEIQKQETLGTVEFERTKKYKIKNQFS